MKFSPFEIAFDEESPYHRCDAAISREYRMSVNYYGFREDKPFSTFGHVIHCDNRATHAYTVDGWNITAYRCNHHTIENSQAFRKLTLKEALIIEVLYA